MAATGKVEQVATCDQTQSKAEEFAQRCGFAAAYENFFVPTMCSLTGYKMEAGSIRMRRVPSILMHRR